MNNSFILPEYGKLSFKEAIDLSLNILHEDVYKYIVVERVNFELRNYMVFEKKFTNGRLDFGLKNNKELSLIVYYEYNIWRSPETDVCTILNYTDGKLLWRNPVFKTLDEANKFKEKIDKQNTITGIIE
jgi:hypothetical protein